MRKVFVTCIFFKFLRLCFCSFVLNFCRASENGEERRWKRRIETRSLLISPNLSFKKEKVNSPLSTLPSFRTLSAHKNHSETKSSILSPPSTTTPVTIIFFLKKSSVSQKEEVTCFRRLSQKVVPPPLGMKRTIFSPQLRLGSHNYPPSPPFFSGCICLFPSLSSLSIWYSHVFPPAVISASLQIRRKRVFPLSDTFV